MWDKVFGDAEAPLLGMISVADPLEIRPSHTCYLPNLFVL